MATGIRFFEASVGARIAYQVAGAGPPLILVTPWVGHLELSTALSGAAAFHDRLAESHTVIRYDRWGTGLSDRDRRDFGLDADIVVLRELADHLRLRRYALFGPSHGGPVAIATALADPKRVSHLVLYGTRAGPLTDQQAWAAMRDLMLADWVLSRRAMAAVLLEGASAEDIEAFSRLSLESATPEVAIGLQDAAMARDDRLLVEQLRVPTLVLHRRDDPIVPLDEARWLATHIPGAALEILDGAMHVHTVGDSVEVADRICAFTAGGGGRRTAQLTAREGEVLQLVAEGCSNAEVAERLVLSVRTVERHLLNAYRKLGARGRAEATAIWVTIDEPGRRKG